jgi:hypothetical protein
MIRGRRTIVTGCIASLAAVCVASQPSSDIETARAAVADLASESWTDREAASDVLSNLANVIDAGDTLRALELALSEWLEAASKHESNSGDRAEVLARFELHAVRAFFNAPRAGLGITYDPMPTPRGVRLGSTVEGFDSHGKLRSGDVVLSLSGAPVDAGTFDLPVAIASHLPGEEAIISVLRNGEPLDIAVTLGRRDDLSSVRRLDEPVLRRAWAIRMDRLRGEANHDRLDTDAARSVATAPEATSHSRLRPMDANVALGGQPGQFVARHVGGAPQFADANGAEAIVRAELAQLELAIVRIDRDLQAIRDQISRLQLEIPMTADTADGRDQATRMRDRITELRELQGKFEQQKIQLLQDRVRLIRALSQ